MNLTRLAIVILLFCLVNPGSLRSQDTTKSISTNSFNLEPADLLSFVGSFHSDRAFDYVYHLSDKEDTACFETNKALINQSPTEKNYEAYHQLACSLWDLERTKEAEKMFLNIVRSQAKYYTDTYYHSSDVPGDTTTNTYGYGSFTSNYKNSACVYLCMIYIEQKKFDRALAYLNDAVDKYKATYTCGTGYEWQQGRYRCLYSHCYAGLKRYKELLNLLIPYCIEGFDENLVKAIRNLYSEKAIQAALTRAENNVKCELDTFPSFSYQTSDRGIENEKTDTIIYYSGTATINIFGKDVELPSPLLENNERVTKDYFEKAFKESSFYRTLRRLE